MSTQVNFHLQLSSPRSIIEMKPELEAALRNAIRKAVFDVVEMDGVMQFTLTIRGPEIVNLIV